MISFKNITFKYRENNNVKLFEDLSFEIKENNFCAILGRSGAGKSSILYLISGIETIKDTHSNTGEIMLRKQIVDSQKTFVPSENRNLAMIFQTPSLFPHKNVTENILFAMQKLNLKKSEKKAKIADFLNKIKMPEYAEAFPNQLSVGQQQRIAFARAILSGADIILLDEPFSGLDFESKFLLYNLLLEIKRESQRTIILVTHDFEEAAFFGNQFLIINNNKICEYNSIEEIYLNPCSRYTASLFQFTNILEGKLLENGKIRTIFGDVNRKNVRCVGEIPDNSGNINYCIRPEHLIMSRSNLGVLMKIEEIKFFGSYYILLLSTNINKQIIFIKFDRLTEVSQGDEIWIEMEGEVTTFC